MIISCPSCQKKFELDDNLLPENGRTLQCGSCNYKWFFKKKDEIKVFEKQLESNENEKIDNGEVNIDKQLNILKNQNSNKIDKWVLEFETKDTSVNPLMGWESSSDTLNELRLEFSTKELAINYAKKMKIDYEIIEPKKRKTVKKSYADNFLN